MILSKLYRMEKKKTAIVSEYARQGMTRGETLDAMNKGIIPIPVARELAERIKEMPTEMPDHDARREQDTRSRVLRDENWRGADT